MRNPLPPTDVPGPWKKPVGRMQRLVAAGWFWQMFSRCLGASAALTGILWWLLRTQQVSPTPAWILGGACFTVAILAASDWSRRNKMTFQEAIVRLDMGWGFQQQLVTASEGHGAWPPQVPDHPLPLSWKLKPCLPPVFFSLLFLLMGAGLPLGPQNTPRFRTDTEPPDWQALESMASFLEEEELIQEQDAEKIRRDVAQLRAKPATEWYDPASLEATDLLRERVQADANRLQQGVARTAQLVAAAAERRQELNQQQLQQLQERLQELERRMQAGGMQPGEQLQQQLQQLMNQGLPQLNQEQLEQLRQQLEQNQQQLRQALADAGMEGMPGGPGRGGEAADLTLQDFTSNEHASVPLTLPETRPDQMQMGDLLDIRDGEHGDDRPEISRQGGSLQNAGGGGEVIWKDDLLPEDASILQKYFQ